MKKFILGIIEITAGMSLLILVMLLGLKFIGGKFTAKCRYILWTLVMIRLAVPLSFGILPALIEVPVETEPDPVQIQMQVPTADYTPMPQNPVTIPTQEPVQMPSPPVQTPVFTEPETDPITWDDVKAYIPHAYLIGAAVFLLWNLLSYGGYTAKILRTAKEADAGTQKIYEAVCRKKGLSRPPVLLVSPDVNSPAAFGLIRRRIVLPEIAFTENGLAGTLSHEVTHCKRGDLWIKALCLFARAFHWFNPLVHLAAFRCEMEMELSCDESVLTGCSEETRAVYGEVMLDIIRRCRRNRGALTTHFNPKKNAVKARFTNILYGSGKRRGLWLIAVCLVLCLIAGAIVACQTDIPEEENGSENTEEPLPETSESGEYPSMEAYDNEHLTKESRNSSDESDTLRISYLDIHLDYPAHWFTEKIGIFGTAGGDNLTDADFIFWLDEYRAYETSGNGRVWTLNATPLTDFEKTAAHFMNTEGVDIYTTGYGSNRYLIGTDTEYAYVLTLPTDVQFLENDIISCENYTLLQQESVQLLQDFMLQNDITPNPTCPATVVYSPIGKSVETVDADAIWQNFLDTTFAPYKNMIRSSEILDLDFNGLPELLVYDRAYGACEIYTIENGQIRGFYTGDSIFTHYADERKPLAEPAVCADDVMYYAAPTAAQNTPQPTFQPAVQTASGKKGYLLCSRMGMSGVKVIWDYYFFAPTDDGSALLTATHLISFSIEAVDDRPENGWYCYINGEMVSGEQFIRETEKLWQELSKNYNVQYTEESTYCELDRIRTAKVPMIHHLLDVLDALNTEDTQVRLAMTIPEQNLSISSANGWGFYGDLRYAEGLSDFTYELLETYPEPTGLQIAVMGEHSLYFRENSDILQLEWDGKLYGFRAVPKWQRDFSLWELVWNWFEIAQYSELSVDPVIPDTGQTFLEAALTYCEAVYNVRLQLINGSRYKYSYVSCSVQDANNREHLMEAGLISEETYTAYLTVVFVPENKRAEMESMAGNTWYYSGNDPDVPAEALEFSRNLYITPEEDGWHIEIGGTGW